MMQQNSILFYLTFIIFCIFGRANDNSNLKSELQSDSLPGKILIINSFDAMSLHSRKNKRELFRELSDSLEQYLYNEIRYRGIGEPAIFPELLIKTSASDSGIFRVMNENAASTSIVIRNLDVYFNQTGVEVSGKKGSKKRIASYDICSVITYDTYNNEKKMKSSETKFCEFFTKRDVISGFFSGGPDVVGKSKYTFEIVNKNAGRFLLFDFP